MCKRIFHSQIISPVLRALADENEYVRETAYKAGQRLVTSYADSALTLLLPELEKGMFDDNWRIRHSSVQLLGDLLYKVRETLRHMCLEYRSTFQVVSFLAAEQSRKLMIDTSCCWGFVKCHLFSEIYNVLTYVHLFSELA